MIPTPSTSHVPYEKVYEPAEDSFLFLDTLSSDSEKAFLKNRFNQANDSSNINCKTPLVVEVGSGSGIVISFVHAHCETILGRTDVLTAGIDVNIHACKATEKTVSVAELQSVSHGFYLGNILGDLTMFLKPKQVDLLIFNPPYVPTPELPTIPMSDKGDVNMSDNSYLLSLSFSGGHDGMEITDRLLNYLPELLSPEYGCAYLLLCAQNKPEKVKNMIQNSGNGFLVKTVGVSGKYAGWEKLQIIRIWRE
ncbi:putative n -glutamine methyltransferase mtq2 [Erysiphe necator]|uniref:Putative n-glutamine methyltransferase mtq2 n=1 Tax=Uncinula necator TaxID=52586 RepID=A0A0B1PDD0_UNCNE|nr:putative n -glutamine methyltransferase mtq2 [Erysiphe necator]